MYPRDSIDLACVLRGAEPCDGNRRWGRARHVRRVLIVSSNTATGLWSSFREMSVKRSRRACSPPCASVVLPITARTSTGSAIISMMAAKHVIMILLAFIFSSFLDISLIICCKFTDNIFKLQEKAMQLLLILTLIKKIGYKTQSHGDTEL